MSPKWAWARKGTRPARVSPAYMDLSSGMLEYVCVLEVYAYARGADHWVSQSSFGTEALLSWNRTAPAQIHQTQRVSHLRGLSSG